MESVTPLPVEQRADSLRQTTERLPVSVVLEPLPIKQL